MVMERSAATFDYNFPCSEHVSCIDNYVAQLRGYLVLLVYMLQLNIGHLKCLHDRVLRGVGTLGAQYCDLIGTRKPRG